MRRSHLISLFILFIGVSVIILIQAFTGPSSDRMLNAPTRLPASAATPGTPTPSQTPSSPSPTLPPSKVERPVVDLSQFEDLSTASAMWNVNSDPVEGDAYNRTYTIEDGVAAIVEGYEFIYRKPEGPDREIYLTFNLAYTNREEEILDILKEHNIKAAFFVSKQYLEDNAETVQRILEEGHLVGTRGDLGTTTMVKASAQKFCDILWGMEEQYQKIAGDTNRMLYYRPDAISKRDMELAQAMGYTVVFRSFQYNDYDDDTDPNRGMELLQKNTADGVIFQLSVTKVNERILANYISWAQGQGYTFKRLDQ